MKLDVVGAQEAASILGVEVPRISRWRKNKMPPIVCEVKATPIWQRKDIEYLAKHGEWKGKPPKQLDLVGTFEVADILGDGVVRGPFPKRVLLAGKPLNKSQIGRWRREGRFPSPLLDKRQPDEAWKPGAGLGATPLWSREQIEQFRRERVQRAA